LEEEVGGFGFEGDVADLVHYEEGVGAELGQLGVEVAGVVGGGEAVDRLGGGGEGDAVAGLAGADGQTDREVGLAGAGWAEEDHVLLRGDEVQGAQVGDLGAGDAAQVALVEVLEGLEGGEVGGADARFAAVGLVSRAATSRCRQAVRNSVWVQFSATARSARRSAASSRAGAFIARV
jgi:hypothetical protein